VQLAPPVAVTGYSQLLVDWTTDEMNLLYLMILAGVLVGLATGGCVRHLAALRLRYWWALPVAVAMQLPWIFRPPVPPEQGSDPLRFWLPLAFGPILVFLVANRRLPGMRLALAGAVANAAVILVNGGLMPTNEMVLRRAGMHDYLIQTHTPGMRLPRSKDVLLPREDTRLWWLGDILIGPPVPRRSVMSLGDLFLATGLGVLAAQGTRGKAGNAPVLTTSALDKTQEFTRKELEHHVCSSNRRKSPQAVACAHPKQPAIVARCPTEWTVSRALPVAQRGAH
jgi:hypothetical protein